MTRRLTLKGWLWSKPWVETQIWKLILQNRELETIRVAYKIPAAIAGD